MRTLPPVLFLALIALAAPRVQAQSYVEMLDDATLYAEPSVYATAVATIPEEGVAELLHCASSWCEVRAGDVRGYIRQRSLMTTDRRPPPRPSPPAPPSPAPQPTPPPDRPEQPVAAPPPATVPVDDTAPARATTPVQELTAAQTPAPTPRPSPAQRPAPASPPPPEAASYKNPTAGTLLSAFLPGTGHLYAGEPEVGTVLLLVSLSAPTVGYLLSDRTADATCVPSPADDRSSCRDTTDYGPLFVGIGIAATAWVAGLLDAGAAVRRANERASNVHVSPVADAGYAGLTLRVSL